MEQIPAILTSITNLAISTPPNCFFEVDDFESKWEFMEPFDFIFGRNIAGCARDFPLLFRQAKESLNNGGWIEFSDFIPIPFSDDGTDAEAPITVDWCANLIKASRRFGKDLNAVVNYKQWMIDAGFKNVREEVYKVFFVPSTKSQYPCPYRLAAM